MNVMEELKSGSLKRPLDKQNLGLENAALNSLIKDLNNPNLTGAVVPNGEETHVVPTSSPLAAPVVELPPPVDPPATAAAVAPRSRNRLCFTGRLAVGKDWCATQAGATIFGFADPLYYLAKFFFHIDVAAEKNKDLPGMRAFLQMIGQWGRAEVNEQYPLTPVRAIFISAIRSLAHAGAVSGYEVEWPTFGANPDIWLNACVQRVAGYEGRAAITNVRFENEFKRLKSEGWTHWHVMTDKKTWADRLKEKGLTTDSPAVKDASERLADGIDRDVIKKISAQKIGPKLRVIWNSAAPPISPRIFTVAEFLQKVAADDAPPAAQTGE